MEVEAGEHVLAFPVVLAILAFVVIAAEEVKRHNSVQIDDAYQKAASE